MRSKDFGNHRDSARNRLSRNWLTGVWRNPLARPADRWHAGLRILLLLLWALALPLAATVSSLLVADGLQAAEQQAGDRSPTTAVLLVDAPVDLLVAGGASVPAQVQVQSGWSAPDGTSRTGPLTTTSGSPAGTGVEVWVDRAGALVDAPVRPGEVVGSGVFVGGGLWLAWGSVLLLIYRLSVRSLDRGRIAEWDRQLLGLAPR